MTPSCSAPHAVAGAPLAPIPNHLVFIWFGDALPPFARVAIQSALHHNPGARVSLFHDGRIAHEALGALGADPRLSLRRIDIGALIDAACSAAVASDAPALDRGRLLRAWNALSQPAARSNLVRLLVLAAEGGVYLDTDTLTLRSLAPLLKTSAFCGSEHILWPFEKLDPARFYFWLGGPLLTALRHVLGRVAYGYRSHRWLLGFYERAVNNAVIGFCAAHPVTLRALARVAELDEGQWGRRFRLGTHLLQEVLQDLQGPPERSGAEPSRVQVLSPEHFYPLGPVVSRHYFRRYTDAAAVARELIGEQTYVVHWYGSVVSLAPLGEAFIRQNADHVVFAHLCRRALEATGSHAAVAASAPA